MINHDLEPERYNASYQLIKTLVTALKEPKSFYFGFDSLKTISIQTSLDKKFRIFSWHVMNNDGSYRYYGTVQINSSDGKLKLFPLVDNTPFMSNPQETSNGPDKWYGAQYYQIIPVLQGLSQPYYVLLGWKGNTALSTKKVIDVLYFKEGNPVFGLPVFDGNAEHVGKKRIVFEYAREVSMTLNYTTNQQRIIFDHLVPYDASLKDDFSKYGPDMSHDAYQLFKGRWRFQQNLILTNEPTDKDDQFNDPKKLKGSQPIRKY